MNRSRTLRHFVWYDCLTPDIDGCLNYLKRLVDCDALDQSWPNIGRYPILQSRTGPIAGVLQLPKLLQDGGVPSYWTGYVETSIEAASRAVPQLGGQMVTAPMQSPMGTSFVFTDTGGAVLAAYESSAAFITPSSSNPGEFVWRRLYSADHERSIRFYDAVFGWKQSDEIEGQWVDESGALVADLAGAPSWLPSDTWVHFLGVQDLAATITSIEQYGGTVLEGAALDHRPAVVSRDPQGAVVGFVQWE
ncbi:MAG: VOC family protein [Pseudomonadota bacterium]